MIPESTGINKMYGDITKCLVYACLVLGVSVVSMPNQPNLTNDSDIASNVITQELTIVSRADWQARPPRSVTKLNTPVPYVVVHHTYIPGSCNSTEECAKCMRSMQNYHMDDQGWNDIGYNFCVGGDGKVYEGRGWTTEGAHAGGTANRVSVGICLIGDWTAKLPPAEQLRAAKALIQAGLSAEYISQQYDLLGHRQVRNTECPGEALFKEIQTWNHFSEHPKSHLEPLGGSKMILHSTPSV